MRVSARFLDVLNYLSATDSYDGARSYQVYDGRHRGEYDYGNQEEGRRKPAVPFQVIKRRAVQRRFLAHLQHQTVVTVGSFVERYLPLGSLVHQPTSGRVSSAAAEFVKRNGETTGRKWGDDGTSTHPLFSLSLSVRTSAGLSAEDGFDVESICEVIPR